MERLAAGAVLLLMFAPPSLAAGESPSSPFTIERTVQPGGRFTAAKGQIVYAEKSFGRFGTFLAEPMPQGDWPVPIGENDELLPHTFKGEKPNFWTGRLNAKVERLDVFCSKKFGEIATIARQEVRPTLCFIDRDADGAFDQAVEGYARVFGGPPGFSSALFDIPRGLEFLATDGEDIAPIHYAKRLHKPDAGKEAVVELRYDGPKGDKLKLTVLSRIAGETASTYEKQIEVARPAGTPTEVVLEHPILGSPGFRRMLGHDRPPAPADAKPRTPRPIPTMTISIAKADAKAITGTIAAPYPEWVWDRNPCEMIDVVKSAPPPGPPAAVPQRQCDTATWRDGTTISSTSIAVETTTADTPKP